MDSVQLLCVGGGFAGLCCATAAAARGVDTLVLEKRARPGDRVHTTGILVKEVADAWDVPRALTRKISAVRLYGPNLSMLDLRSPGYYFLATDTPGLLGWLDQRARDAGANVVRSASFVDRGRGATGRGSADVRMGARKQVIGFDFLVGSDGARSGVAESFGLGRNREFLGGVELEFEGVRDLDEDCLHVFIDTELAPGYIAWVVPGVGITQVGLAVRRPAVPRVRDFVAKISKLFNFDDAKLVSRRGGVIPCGGVVKPNARGRVMLIGDAAGMVSPLTAGGIHTAMDMGRAAGVALSNHLLDGDPGALSAFERQVPSFFFKQILRRGFDLPVPNAVCDRLMDSRAFRAVAQNIFFHHRGLFSVRAWRDMVWNTGGRATLFR